MESNSGPHLLHVGAFIQEQLVQADEQGRDLSSVQAMIGIPKHWDGLMRLGYRNRIYCTSDFAKGWFMWQIFKTFKNHAEREQRYRYYALLASLEHRLPLLTVVIIASGLLEKRSLRSFKRYLYRDGHRSSVIESRLTTLGLATCCT